ncbi:2-dehydropantoate 2-reductase N-terminal domain-containing protein [soil metagenome]
MRFVVFGAGAVGGVVGGRLFHHGHDVVLVARGDHLDAIKTDGLLLQDPEGEVRPQVPAGGGAAEIEWRDNEVCLLAVKSQDTHAVLDDLVAHASPTLRIGCLQNGVDNERQVLRRFPHVYGICVMLPSAHLEPGLVQASSAPVTGALNIGRYPSGVDETVAQIAAAFESSTLLSVTDEEIMAQKYAKLVMNLGNAVEALTGPLQSGDELIRRARQEASDVFDAAGITVAPRGHDAAQREQITMRPIGGERRGGGSTWQSLARGGRVESDYLNGEIVLLGRLHGVDAPVNELLARVATEAAGGGVAPGSMTSANLLDRL